MDIIGAGSANSNLSGDKLSDVDSEGRSGDSAAVQSARKPPAAPFDPARVCAKAN
jgi:hypothetical protein